MEKETILSGGAMNRAVRIGDTVHRTVKGHPMLHSYLLYLEKAGMHGVPRFLGIDGQGREILTFLPGKTIGPDYPPLHPDGKSRGPDSLPKNHGAFKRTRPRMGLIGA